MKIMDIRINKERILLSSKQPAGLLFICASIFLISFGSTSALTLFADYGTNVLNFNEKYAITISISSFLFLVNFTALLGGIIGQRYTYKKVVLIGGLYTTFGLWLISYHNLALMGISIFAVGGGLILPNIYASLSRLYSTDDPRRKAGFTILFMSSQLAYFLNYILATYCIKYISYEHAFIISAIFTLLGTIGFVWFDKDIPKQPLKHLHQSLINQSNTDKNLSIIAIMVIITGITRYLLDNISLNIIVMLSLCTLSIFYIVYIIVKNHSHLRYRVLGLLLLIFIYIAFWFTERLSSIIFIEYSHLLTHGNIFGWVNAPNDAVNILNTMVIAIVAILFTFYWTNKKKGDPALSIPSLIGYSLTLSALTFLLLWSAQYTNSIQYNKIANICLVFSVLFMAVAKTIAIPLYYGLAGKLAPRDKEAIIIGIMQLFIGFSGIMSIRITDNIAPNALMLEHNSVTILAVIIILLLITLSIVCFFMEKKWSLLMSADENQAKKD
jgi:proton-dependent oligopeptide transporter, POT family